MTHTLFRASPPEAAALDRLGPLAQLPGTWMGGGFSLIARPDFQHGKPFFLQLNATQETLSFTPIGGPVPNRGSQQDDIEIFGLHYLQRVVDAETKGALHIEPGLWLNVPETTVPGAPATVARLATIPHGDSVLAQGTEVAPEPGPPSIMPISSKPLPAGQHTALDQAGYLDPYQNTQLPPGISREEVHDPNVVLSEAIFKQTITETVTLQVSTTDVVGGLPGNLVNLPFVVENANATSVSATFWIETVDNPEGGQFLQLQYTQTVILNFLDINWPHISVGTLVKQ